MSNVQIKLDKAGVRTQILQADYMMSFIGSEALKKSSADDHVKSFIGFDRAKAIIYPDKEH